MTKLNKTLINDINHVKTQLSNSITDLKENIGKYTNVSIHINSNVSHLGDLDKALECVKMGIKTLKFKENKDNPKKPKSSDYVFVHGFSNDIFSCLNNLGKFCNAQVSDDLVKKFSLKVGKSSKKTLGQLFVEKFFIRNSYLSIKNGNTNLNKSYEIIDSVIVTKTKKDKNNNSKNDKSKNDKSNEANSNDENFDFNLQIITNEISSDKEYGNFTTKDIHEKMKTVLNAMLKDNGLESKQFNEYLKSLKQA